MRGRLNIFACELKEAFIQSFDTLPQSAVQLLHSSDFNLNLFTHLREIIPLRQDFHIYFSFFLKDESKAIQIFSFNKV